MLSVLAASYPDPLSTYDLRRIGSGQRDTALIDSALANLCRAKLIRKASVVVDFSVGEVVSGYELTDSGRSVALNRDLFPSRGRSDGEETQQAGKT